MSWLQLPIISLFFMSVFVKFLWNLNCSSFFTVCDYGLKGVSMVAAAEEQWSTGGTAVSHESTSLSLSLSAPWCSSGFALLQSLVWTWWESLQCLAISNPSCVKIGTNIYKHQHPLRRSMLLQLLFSRFLGFSVLLHKVLTLLFEAPWDDSVV